MVNLSPDFGFVPYNALVSYLTSVNVVFADGKLYTSQQDGNVGNDPSADDGTWWKPFAIQLEDNVFVSVTVNCILPNLLAGTPTFAEGNLFWADEDKTWAIHTNVEGVTLQIGQEVWMRLRNTTGDIVYNGQAVYINGSVGNKATVGLAKADDPATSSVIAVATHDIANNNTGFFTITGLVRDLNTTGIPHGEVWVEGTTLYLSAATEGELTSVAPISPNTVVTVATVEISHATIGRILVHIQLSHDQYLTKLNGHATKLTVTGGIETVTAVVSGATMTLDMDLGPIHEMDTQDENTTMALSNAGSGKSASAALKQGAGGGKTISVPGAWIPFITPTPTTTAGEWNHIETWQIGSDVFYTLKGQV